MLDKLIHDKIKALGYMTVADYMNLCLLHPEYGYYTTQQVFGTTGDFITAPEISQLFGETLGVWATLEWERVGKPASFNLVELGPGRGTLMADLLRATKHVDGFHAACTIQFVEASAKLQEQQKQAISDTGVNVVWHETISGLVFDKPTIVIANEFFDALPIQQFIIQNRQWHERIIVLKYDKMDWSFHPKPVAESRILPDTRYQMDETICEYSAQIDSLFKTLCANVKKAKGSMAIIDYGDHTVNRFGDTLQAVKDHDYIDVLSDAGQADLTAHVDFYQLDQIADSAGLVTDFMTQGDFLKHYGITERVNQLSAHATAQKNTLISGYQRLIDPDQMGNLFKVLTVQTK